MANAYSSLGPARGTVPISGRYGKGRGSGRRTIGIPGLRPFKPAGNQYGKPIPQNWHPGTTTPPGAAPGQPASSGGPYVDSTALGNIGQNTYDVNQRIGGIQLRDAQAGVALQQALAKLAYQQPRDALSLEQGANRGGSLYSSVYGQNQGDLQTRYANANTSAQTGYSNQMQGDAAQITGLQGGIPIYNAGQYAAAAQRGSVAAQKDPSTGEPLPGTPVGRVAQSVVGSQGAARGLTKGQPGRFRTISRGRPRVRSYL